MRRLWLSLAMLGAGGALMVVAQLAGAATQRAGRVFVVGTTGASVQVDPQLAYITTAWWLEYATAAKLYNYPDKRGPAGSVLRSRGRLAGSRSRTEAGATHSSSGKASASATDAGDRAELRVRDRPRREP